MKQTILNRSLMLVFFSAAILLFAFSEKRGGDYFKVLLNDKMIAEQYLTVSKPTTTYSLNSSNSNDHFTFYYSHCGTVGKGRAILLKNEKGDVLKEWKFADSKSFNMDVPVKEIFSAWKSSGATSVYYNSKEMSVDKLLVLLKWNKPATAKL